MCRLAGRTDVHAYHVVYDGHHVPSVAPFRQGIGFVAHLF